MSSLSDEFSRFNWHMWEDLTPNALGTLLLIWAYFRFGLDFYLCSRQYDIFKTKQEIPTELSSWITKEIFERSRLYRVDRIKLRMFSYLYNAFLTTIYIEYGILAKLWEWSGMMLQFIMIWPTSWEPEVGQTMCAIAIGTIFFNIVEMPLHLYFVFSIEQRHGFNKQTLLHFIKDHLLTNIIEISFGSMIGAFIVEIVKAGGQYFYIWLWIVAYLMAIFFLMIYPTFIAPLFDTFEPLPKGQLRTRLTRLATICDFPLDDILIIKESSRTAHSGAYFFGLWNSKRIVLYDNLLIGYPEADYFSNDSEAEANTSRSPNKQKVYTEEEIEAIVCHEIGHWKNSHMIEEVVLAVLDFNLLFLAFSFIYQNSVLYEAFQFPKKSKKKPIFLGLHIVVNHILDIWNFVVGYAFKYRTRQYEYDADKFAVSMDYGEPLKVAIMKMFRDNLNYPYFDKIYSSFIHHHPPELYRLDAINAEISKRN